MAEFTKGPLYADGTNVMRRLHGNSGPSIIVARMAGHTDESHANASLFASAPDYVAARQSLFDAIKHGDQEHKDWLRDAIDAHFAAADAHLLTGAPAREPGA